MTFFSLVSYSDSPDELRRTNDEREIVPLGGDVARVVPIPETQPLAGRRLS